MSDNIPDLQDSMRFVSAEEIKDLQPNPITQFFAYEHLPEHLQRISKPFGELARYIDQKFGIQAPCF